ncbi:MAG TPA: TetR/AcrR family transcriptional regulator C-terminal domain-containing protein [Ktedonobacterales bacterium]
MRLRRETIVREALALVDERGLDSLTVRRLAEQLDVQNPALYRHFESKQDLLDSMAETMMSDGFAPLEPPTPQETWDVWLARLARVFRQVMLSHRDGARIIAGARLSQRGLLLGLDQALQLLQGHGFEPAMAFHAIRTVFDYTLGSVFEEQADQLRSSARIESVQRVNETEPLPALMAALGEIARRDQAGEAAEGFEAGLQFIIAGLRATNGAP